MSVITAALRELVAAGITGDQLIAAIERIEAAANAEPTRSKHAEAQARYREKNKNKASHVITRDHTDHGDDAASLSDKERSPTPSKEINSPSSEPNGSGVAALQSALAENVIVLTDPRSDLFGRGLKLLAGMTGKPEGQLRGLLGRWLKAANDDAVKVLRAVEDAARNRVADAVPWIEAALKRPVSQAAAKPAWVLEQEKMRRWL